MKKLTALLCVLLSFCLLFTGCGEPSTPAGKFSKMEVDAVDGVVDALSTSLGNAKDAMKGSFSLSVEISDQLLSSLGDVSAYIGDVRKIGIECSYDYSMDKGLMGLKATLNLQNTEIVGAEVVIDANEGALYVALPGLSDAAVKMDMGYAFDPTAFAALDYIDEITITKDAQNLLRELLTTAYNNVGDVVTEETTITVDGVEQNCVSYTADIDSKDLENIVRSVLQNVRNNKQFVNVVWDYVKLIEKMIGEPAGITKEQFRDTVNEGIDEALEDLYIHEEVAFTYVVYADKKGNQIGREIIVDGAFTFTMLEAQDGSNYAAIIELTQYGNALISYTENGTKKGDAFTGDAVLEVSGLEILTIKAENFVSDVKKQTVSGVLTIKLGSALEDMLADELGYSAASILSGAALKITLEGNSSSSKIVIEPILMNMNIGSITIESSIGGKYSAKKPTNLFNGDMNEYGATLDINEILNRLKKAGIPSNVISMLTGF